MARLKLVQHNSNAKRPPPDVYNLNENETEVLVGRRKGGLTLLSICISRVHAVLRKTHNGWQIQDKRAVNRVYVCDEVLPPGASRDLEDKDLIQFGVKPVEGEMSEFFIYQYLTQADPPAKRKRSPMPSTCKRVRISQSDEDITIDNVLESAAKEKEKALAEAQRLIQKAEEEREAIAQKQMALEEARVAEQQEAMAKLAADLKREQEVKMAEISEMMRAKEEKLRREIAELQETNRAKERELEEAKTHEQKLEELEKKLAETVADQVSEERKSLEAATALQDRFSEIMESDLQCSICAEMFIKPKVLQCGHAYCEYCIDTWLVKKKECPICRAKSVLSIPSFVLENYIQNAVQTLSDEKRDYRKSVIAAREAELAEQKKLTQKSKGKGVASRRQNNRQNNRGAQSSTSRAPRSTPSTYRRTANNVPTSSAAVTTSSASSSTSATTSQAPAVETPVVAQEVVGEDTETILLSSDSDEDSYDSLYENEDGYTGIPGMEYRWGGFGYCYSCGDEGHWAPQCPY